jgi:beta-N-acetylhexosaminidase
MGVHPRRHLSSSIFYFRSSICVHLCASVVAFLIVFALVSSPLVLAQKQTYPRFDRALTKKEEQWVRKTLASLKLDEKIGQMFTVDTNAVFMNRESDEYKRLRHHIVDNKVGGVILFRSDVWASAMLTNRLQEMAKVPLLVSADLEMGMGMRLDDTPWWAPNMAVAATGDVKYARLQGEYTAREARATGINWLYAPVADVNNNPQNPVINVRSYGEDPQTVAAFTSAFIEGAQAAGALATAKHFPGHGDTATDSHIGLPVVDVSKERLDQLELVPFRAAIASNVGSIMTAHIALPQIEPEQAAPLRAMSASERASAEFLSETESNAPRVTLPATLSSKVLTGVLRDELKFKGLVVTDAMTMAGVAARYEAGAAAVQAIKAGADMVLKSPDIDAAIQAVKQAVERGEISEARINASVGRLLRAKAALSLNERRTVKISEVDRLVSDPQFNAAAQEIADRSITLVRNEQNALPLNLNQQERKTRLLSITFTDEENRNVTQPFVAELRRLGAQVDALTLDNRSTERDLERVRARLNASAPDAGPVDAVIYCVSVRTQSGKGSVALPPMGARLAEELSKVKMPEIVISFGNPYLLMAMPKAPVYLAAYSPFPVSQRAAARGLVGEIDITGKLPVTLPGLYPRGHGLEIKRKLGQESGERRTESKLVKQ